MQNNSKKKYPVKRMNISINMEKTGARIRRVIEESGYTMREIMEITGITTEQAVYKWYSGKSIPSLETQIILCRLLGLRITDLLVLDGECDFSDDHSMSNELSDYIIIAAVNEQRFTDYGSRRLAAYYNTVFRDAV